MYKSIIKNSIKASLALLLCIVFIFPLGAQQACGNSNASADKIVPSWREKIEDELWAEMETKTDTDIIPIWLGLVDTVDYEAVDEELRVEKGIDPAVYENEERLYTEVVQTIISELENSIAGPSVKGTSISLDRNSEIVRKELSDRVDEYVLSRRSIIRREYLSRNTSFVNNYIGKKDREIFYLGEYTSTLIIEATKSEIAYYAKLDEVDEMSLHKEVECFADSDRAVEQVFADEAIGTKSSRYSSGTNTGYKGRGVTIGILEYSSGNFDGLNPQLKDIAGKRLFVLQDGYTIYNYPYASQTQEQIGTHCTMVTNMIVGQAKTAPNGIVYEGVSPLATVYQSSFADDENMIEKLDELLTQGCNVINLSFGIGRSIGYSNIDKELDKKTNNAGAVIVKSAGNIVDGVYDNRIITGCGKALNCITVGNAETKDSISITQAAPHEVHSSSSYEEASFLPNKPDIVAPGINMGFYIRNGTVSPVSGTSLAAPIVTGIIAQMMEANVSLKTESGARRAKAILLAGADYYKIDTDRDNTTAYCIDDVSVGPYFREVSGVGLVNAANAVNIALRGTSVSGEHRLNPTNQIVAVDIGTLTTGQKIRMVMTFFKGNDEIITSTAHLDDVDLALIKKSSGEQVATSKSNINNVEVIEYLVAQGKDGSHKYSITLEHLYSPYVDVAIAWAVWRPGDLNNDNVVNSLDASLLLNFDANLSTLTPEQMRTADVVKDGVINSIDATHIQRFAAGLETSPERLP